MKRDVYEEKRKKALEFLGKRWVLHPEYQFDPKHSQIGAASAKFVNTVKAPRSISS